MIRHLTPMRPRGERAGRALAPRSLAACGYVLLTAALVSACSGSAPAPRSLPDGPPPEYEAPRPFDMGGLAPTSSASPSAAPQAPEVAPPPSPSAPAPSAPSAAPPSNAPPSPTSAPR